MTDKKKPINIELRSEEVKDILSRPPHWMIRSGNTIMIALVFVVFALSYFISYPDTISAEAVVTGKTPPVYINSKVAGRISGLKVSNGQQVQVGQVVAELDNPVSFTSIQKLKALLNQVREVIADTAQSHVPVEKLLEPEELFEGAGDYLQLLKILDEYKAKAKHGFGKQSIANLEFRYRHEQKIKSITLNELKLNTKSLKNAEERFRMKAEEYQQNLTTRLDFLNAQSAYYESLRSKEAFDKALLQLEVKMEELLSEKEALIFSQQEEKSALQQQIIKDINTLENYATRWQRDYTIKSPVSGTIDFMGRRKVNQLIDPTERLFAVIPANEVYEVEVNLPLSGFGKVSLGQMVKVELHNYPANQFGVLLGEVAAIPALPYEEVYTIKVSLSQGLTTTFGHILPHNPEAKARAEIVTQNFRLIERFIGSLAGLL